MRRRLAWFLKLIPFPAGRGAESTPGSSSAPPFFFFLGNSQRPFRLVSTLPFRRREWLLAEAMPSPLFFPFSRRHYKFEGKIPFFWHSFGMRRLGVVALCFFPFFFSITSDRLANSAGRGLAPFCKNEQRRLAACRFFLPSFSWSFEIDGRRLADTPFSFHVLEVVELNPFLFPSARPTHRAGRTFPS